MTPKILEFAQEITMKDTPEEAVSITLKVFIEQRIKKYKSDIKKFERKYGMSFKEFHKKLGREYDLSWEHEKDYLDWEEATTNLKYFEESSKRLGSYAQKVR